MTHQRPAARPTARSKAGRSPSLVHHYIRNCVIGFVLSALFVAGLLWLNVVGLRDLVTGTEGGFIAVFMLFVFNGLVFAGVQFAVSIMLIPRESDDGSGGHRPPVGPATPPLAAQPAPVRIR